MSQGGAATRWSLSELVEALKLERQRSLANRQRGPRPTKLPSRRQLLAVIDGIRIALFPNRLGEEEIAEDGLDYFVGHTLDKALRSLVEEVQRELFFDAETDEARAAAPAAASALVTRFAGRLPRIRGLLEGDIQAAFEGDPAARSVDEILACYPGITAIIHHRLAHELYVLGAPLVGRIIADIAHANTGVDIHPGAQIGERFFIDHGTGVVIGETTIIGARVRLYQAVTLGAKRFPTAADGSLIKGIPRHPIVEDDVVIYAGATVLGRITVGRGSSIGGNVWVTQNVAPGTHLTQATSRADLGQDAKAD